MRRPKKSLSQNFIKDKNICNKILRNIDVNNKIILEIGPGYGFLTDIILDKKPKKIYLIEKDNELSKYLIKKYVNNKIVEIINTDILNFNLTEFDNFKKISIVSNLPYNISTKIILNLLYKSSNIEEMVFMIQKEVAEKFNYNLKKINKYKFLSKIYSDYKICFNVSPNVFFPKPKVLSSVVKFKIKNYIVDEYKIKKFISIIFVNKRKKISNKINKYLDAKFQKITSKRIDELSMEEVLEIYDSF